MPAIFLFISSLEVVVQIDFVGGRDCSMEFSLELGLLFAAR